MRWYQTIRINPRPPRAARPALAVGVLLLSLLAGLARPLPAASAGMAKPGDLLPPWTEGCLDIHHINTGKGESSFFILPDGTTLLVDAGNGSAARPPWGADPMPNGKREPGEWIARYIVRALQNAPEKKLNYVMLSHFHDDHMGHVRPEMKSPASGAYKLSGITEVAEHVPFETIIDRGWPDYNYPVPLNDPKMANYKKFLAWQVKNKDLRVERFKVGVNNQLTLRHDPAKYPDFAIRNLAANGVVWTGEGEAVRDCFADAPTKDKTENKCSIAFRLSYGAFDYFTGGDLDVRGVDTAPPATRQWRDIEAPVAKAAGPVEVAKANHHGNYDANSVFFLRTLRPRVIVIDTWGASQPSFGVWRRMKDKETYPGPRDVFATNIMEPTALAIRAEKEVGQHHIVIRVSPGGAEYYVYRLHASDESGRIKSVHGPYKSE